MTVSRDLLRSEWIKLRSLTINVVLASIATAFMIVVPVLISALAGTDTVTSDEVLRGLAQVSILSGMLVSVIGVLSVSSEFGFGTIRPTVVATPHRASVFLSKATLLAAVAAVVSLAVGLVAYSVSGAIVAARGGEFAWFESEYGSAIAVFAGLPAFFALLVLFGFGLGLLIRISPAAVALAILWPLLIEGVIAVVIMLVTNSDDPSAWLPYQSASVLVEPDADSYPRGRLGALYFTALVALLVGGAIFSNTRRDV